MRHHWHPNPLGASADVCARPRCPWARRESGGRYTYQRRPEVGWRTKAEACEGEAVERVKGGAVDRGDPIVDLLRGVGGIGR